MVPAIGNTCGSIPANVDDCLNKGKEISQWFMERLLNPGTLCN